MLPEAYQAFTRALLATAEGDPAVLGVVALGSTSGEGASPDVWSDHDLFLVVRAGEQERYRADLRWLPRAHAIALRFRETAHGLKVVYDDGHLVELAVFEPGELQVARVNRYRVLLDRGGVAEAMAGVRRASAAQPPPDDAWSGGQLLTALLVGAGRYARGERLAGHRLVKGVAVEHLARLVARHVPPADPAVVDDLDPQRRFERAWPSVAAEVWEALEAPVPAAARRLLATAVEAVPRGVAWPAGAVAVVEAVLDRAAQPGRAAPLTGC